LFNGQASWPDLMGTERETRDILELYRKSRGQDKLKLLRGREAKASHFAAALEQKWRYVHFAGHGYFADEAAAQTLSPQPLSKHSDTGLAELELQALSRNQLLLSGLVLARDEGQGGPGVGVLTAEDLGSLDLRGTELVVLSACE